MSGDRIKAKIAALRAKTSAAGCTEAEALAAAELAARLMADHGLSEADMVMSEALGAGETARPTWRTKLGAVIGVCTNCATLVLYGGAGNTEILFTGRAPGPEIAVYLRDVCIRAVEAELRRFKAGEFYRRRRSAATRRQAAADFVDGMVDLLSRRLFHMFRSTMDRAAIAEAKEARAARHGSATAFALQERKGRFFEASHAGRKAGSEVALNHGVGSAEMPVPALTHRRGGS